jgi:protein-tyrosine-phosphatase
MVIHFVCRGNTHRSRLAEAYAKSLTPHLHDITILSSGIEADRDLNGRIVPFVKLLLQNENLLQLTGTTWTQTTQLMIDHSDVIVFMNDDVHEDAVKQFDIPLAASQTWQIADVQGVYGQIKSAIDALLSQLRIGAPDPSPWGVSEQ